MVFDLEKVSRASCVARFDSAFSSVVGLVKKGCLSDELYKSSWVHLHSRITGLHDREMHETLRKCKKRVRCYYGDKRLLFAHCLSERDRLAARINTSLEVVYVLGYLPVRLRFRDLAGDGFGCRY